MKSVFAKLLMLLIGKVVYWATLPLFNRYVQILWHYAQ